MQRRTLLGTVGSAGIVALTGCLSDDGSGGGTPSETVTDTSTPTPEPTPTISDSEFTAQEATGEVEVGSATVSVDGSDIVVQGAIQGRNGCQTAQLGGVNYDASTDELTVPVEETRREDAGDVCTTALISISYEATVSFEDGVPGTVVVTHDHGDGPETVTTASP